MSSENSQSDDDQDELKLALMAAFGDDALDMLDDDEIEEIPVEMLAQSNRDLAESLAPTPQPMSWVEDPGENASPLIRYMHDLNRTIYGAMAPVAGAQAQQRSRTTSRSPRFVVFSVDNQQFALPLEDVREISRYPKVTDLPCSPDWLRGVTNLRGQILSVTDLRKLLNPASEHAAAVEKIIVIHSQQHGASTALVVDRIHGIRSLKNATESPENPNQRIASISCGTTTVDQASTILIDPDRLLACDTMFASSESP